jgi:FKBP-type peptidyl-prolyl cis-trans isomerase FkpA
LSGAFLCYEVLMKTTTTKVIGLACVMAFASLAGCKRLSGGGSSATPTTEDDKTLYTLGMLLGRNLGTFNLNASELEMVKAGLTDMVLKNPHKVDLDTYGPKVDVLARKRGQERVEIEKKRSKKYLDQAAHEPGAVVSPSGLVFKTITPGNGASPGPTDRVTVHYEGRLIDGTVFDSSRKRNMPATFPLNGVIKCWTEGVGKMKVGEKAQLVCPSSIAYGDSGRPPTIPGGATLIFDVELLSIQPSNVASAPPSPPITLPPPGGKPGGLHLTAPGKLQSPGKK